MVYGKVGLLGREKGLENRKMGMEMEFENRRENSLELGESWAAGQILCYLSLSRCRGWGLRSLLGHSLRLSWEFHLEHLAPSG